MPHRSALLAASRRSLLTFIFLSCWAVIAIAAENRPNVLLILVDDLKPAIGAYSDPVAVTPNLDRLAARGISFDLAYCNQAVCAPSRNNLMLGARSSSTGLYTLGLNFRQAYPDALTLPQYFGQHGYRTAAVGKVYHVGHGNTDDAASWTEPYHFEPVVDYVLEESTGGQLTREEAYFTNAKTGAPNRELPRGAAWEKADVDDSAYSDGRIADIGIERLNAYSQGDQPFFLALGFTKPHMPFNAPSKYWDLYDREKIPLAAYRERPVGAPSYAHKRYGELAQYTPVPENDPSPLDEELQRSLIHGYYAATSYMDAQVGRVIDELDRLGLSENTIVALWSDHGFHLGDHGSWTKHSNYEQANRIPLYFIAPGVTTPGTRTKALAETVDVFPTLAELANLPPPAAVVPQPFDGHSLVPTLRDPSQPSKPYAYHSYPRGPKDKPLIGRALRTARYRIVEWKEPGAPSDTAEYELYDYELDPLETKNIANQRPELMTELKAYLAALPEAKAQRPKK
ncbi:sulfatase [Pelagicoccus sp. NFK12]|uniref:Sulfatase n=1 Tax=Pelagicoccus enzymogenes TaxID=2773457 RepID=A0A927FA58_9BACT|nr:sulfatase [Pelagicoccus enzymogenes]MBD5780664.1 sulfatase [Pelagicoccus enzymogenes]